jgi:hypothetical protein
MLRVSDIPATELGECACLVKLLVEREGQIERQRDDRDTNKKKYRKTAVIMRIK